MKYQFLAPGFILVLLRYGLTSPVPATSQGSSDVNPEEDARQTRGEYSGGSMFFKGGNFHPHDLYQEQDYEQPYRVEPTVECYKTHMKVTLYFTRPFYGVIYPKDKYGSCTYFTGKGEKVVTLVLNRADCGVGVPQVYYGGAALDAVIMKHLMVQWENDIVQEYDVLLTVRCDHPDEFRKTVVFDIFNVAGLREDYKGAQHPGPQLYMEVQRGEGPKGKPLEGPVYLGETLTLVFTVYDDTFQFDTNVISCWASDANPNPQGYGPVAYPPSKMQVIERGCSLKPKIFANFLKDNTPYPGAFTSTQWCYFKAFRFPASTRVIISCEVEVCYKTCRLPSACGTYQPHYRLRRSTSGNETSEAENPTEVTTVTRHIEVLLPNETDTLNVLRIESTAKPVLMEVSCIQPVVFHTVVSVFVVIVVSLVAFCVILYRKLPAFSK